MTVRACAALAAVLLGGCAVAPAPDAFITGAAISRERLYVPPGAVFDASLVDVTQAGEPPTVLGRQRIAPAGPPPYALRIPYHQARIHARGRYEVRAAVTLEGRLLLDAPGSHPALIDPAYRHADVILARVPQIAATAAAAVPLRQTYWQLVEVVGGAAVSPPAADADAAHLVLQRDGDRATGSGGCNRFVARYRIDGGRLQFHFLSSGMRLCLKDGTSELAYMQQLTLVAAYMQRGRALELRDADGKPLLRFVAQERGEPPPPDDEPPQPA
ncbi:MAG: META domain-containing protein [Proteobacteria bacterium]|nr:META domain-containing protein [Pseudomonadota bacterium]MBS0301235.1 META domain-containing protein [Pseudomonadota bacterium]